MDARLALACRAQSAAPSFYMPLCKATLPPNSHHQPLHSRTQPPNTPPPPPSQPPYTPTPNTPPSQHLTHPPTPHPQDGFEEDISISLPQMPLNSAGQCWAVLRVARGPGAMPSGKLGCVLRFTIKEIDPTTGEAEEEGYEDEYQLEDLDLSAGDYVKPQPVGGPGLVGG